MVRSAGNNSFMCKVDIMRAFRLLLVKPDD